MYARVSKVMTQFVLKIEKLSHIMGPTPILEMARAYGLRPRLWLLVLFNFGHIRRWDQCAVYILYSKISTDPGLLKIRHSHRFVAVVIQILTPSRALWSL